MYTKFLFSLLITLILSVQQLFSQSIYTNKPGSSFIAGVGLSTSTFELNGRSLTLGASPTRGTDFAFVVTEFEGKLDGYYPYSFRNIGGSVTFSPLKQWEESPLTIQTIIGGTKTTSDVMGVQKGLSGFIGASAVRELTMGKGSLYPGISYIYSPFITGKPARASAVAFDMGLSAELTTRLIFIVSPSLTFDLTHNTRNFGIVSGLVF